MKFEEDGGNRQKDPSGSEAGGLGGFAIGRLAVPAGVLALNRAGFGPFRPGITGAELRDSGLRAMSEAVAAMDIRAEHVIFGHTHRPWPVEGLDRDWRTPTGALLHNTGSWYHEGSLDRGRWSLEPLLAGLDHLGSTTKARRAWRTC